MGPVHTTTPMKTSSDDSRLNERDKTMIDTNETNENKVISDGSNSSYEIVVLTDQIWVDCPENPWNWSIRKKWWMMSAVGSYGFLAPLSSSMLAPSLPDIANKFHVADNPTLVNLPLSIYLLAYATGPLIISPLSEIYGRLWILHISNLALFAFNLACAFAPNEAALIVFRFLSGLGGSTFSSMSGSVIQDIFAPKERASAMAFYIMGPLLGPVLGPLTGGFVAERLGYKWVFIITSIFSAAAGIYGFILPLKESYHPLLRDRLVKHSSAERRGILRSELPGKVSDEEKGSQVESQPRWVKYENEHGTGQGKQNIKEILYINMTRPFALFLRSFILFILALFMAIQYGYYYLMFATFSELFPSIYGFSVGITGLCYLGLGFGFFSMTFFGATFSNRIYKKLSDKNNGQGAPEYRMPSLLVGSFLVPIGLFWFGWSAQARIHWIMPIIGSAFYSGGMILTYLSVQLYIVDAFKYAASALASVTVFRSLFGFAFPLFATQMFDALGNGPGMSLLAGVAIVIGIPFPVWIY